MSRFESNILGLFSKSKRLFLQITLSLTGFMFIPGLYASAQKDAWANSRQDSWRRTANGWERVESWEFLVAAPVGKLRPLTLGTLVQRTWPATFAAVELSLVLLILHFGSPNASSDPEEPSG